MNEEFDYVCTEEESFLQVMRELFGQLPQNTMWIAHPQNYPRILRSVRRILQVIRKDSPEATHTISFDELLGTSLCLTVESWTFDFSSCKEFAEILSLADNLGIEAKLDGRVCLSFGFDDARIPIG